MASHLSLQDTEWYEDGCWWQLPNVSVTQRVYKKVSDDIRHRGHTNQQQRDSERLLSEEKNTGEDVQKRGLPLS